jgi:hypothetical protein
MQSYHLAWLSAHPDRTPEWLRDRFRDGFDIHHIDGNHANDDPTNLVLIEHGDHMRLHGINQPGIRLISIRPRKPSKRTLLKREVAYAFCTSAIPWNTIGKSQKVAAQKHAEGNNLPWPPREPTLARV